MISPDVLKSAAAVIPSAKGSSPPISATISTISSQAHLQMISHWHDELEFIYILDGKMDFHIEEKILTDPFDYAAEDALIDSWLAARASVKVPQFRLAPKWGMAYSGPQGRARTQKEFVE